MFIDALAAAKRAGSTAQSIRIRGTCDGDRVWHLHDANGAWLGDAWRDRRGCYHIARALESEQRDGDEKSAGP